MTAAPHLDPLGKFMTARLPWWVGAGGVLLYVLTLNRWVSLQSLETVARVCGWLWHPQLDRPLTALVLVPFGWLPKPWIPFALNLFTALLAGWVLVLLTRSVALLRPEVGAIRAAPDLSGGSSWLPPLLAALLCGLQLSFWEHATNCTGELIDLVVFAYLILCLLEFRSRQGRRWLSRWALVCGLGMANNWAIIGFLPLLVAALLWATRLQIVYDWRWAVRLALWGAAGLSLYLLLPVIVSLSPEYHVDFWSALKANLKAQQHAINVIRAPAFRALVLAGLLPLLVVCIRWKPASVHYTGDSGLGLFLMKLTAHLLHGVFLLIAAWLALDPTFSPRNLNLGVPLLTYYYLAALVVGYSAGYLMLTEPIGIPKWAARSGVMLIWICLGTLPLALCFRNLHQIMITNGPSLRDLARQLHADLPAGKSVVLSDNLEQTLLLEAELARGRNEKHPLLLDTRALPSPEYRRFVFRRAGDRRPISAFTNHPQVLGPIRLLNLLSNVASHEPLVYLDPSFGLIFERFDRRQKGLVYYLQPRFGNEAKPSLTNDLVQPWDERWRNQVSEIEEKRTDNAHRPRWIRQLFSSLRLVEPQNLSLSVVSRAYAKSFNDWAVHLQRNGNRSEASAWFARAVQLNPNNLPAQINAEYNARCQRGDCRPLKGEWLQSQFHHLSGRYANWITLLRDGAVDEPAVLFKVAVGLMEANYYHQAAGEFERCVQLAPDWPEPKAWLALSWINLRQFSAALELTDAIQKMDPAPNQPGLISKLLVCRIAALNGLGRTNESAACLDGFGSEYRSQAEIVVIAAEMLAQNRQFEPALALLDQLHERNDLKLLASKGRIELALARYEPAIATLTGVVARAPSDYIARLNLAVARLGAGQLDAAREDYQILLTKSGKKRHALFGLGTIAWRKQQTNAAIELYQEYLSNAIPGSPQYLLVSERLSQIKSQSSSTTERSSGNHE